MNQTVQSNPNGSAPEDYIPKQTSILFESVVIWIVSGGLCLAVWFRFLPLIVVFSFLLFLSFTIRIWKKQSLIRVQPTLAMTKSRLFAGEQFSVQASVSNNKRLPLVWLEWEFPAYGGILWGDGERDRYVIRFLWMLWFQRMEWDIQGTALERGVYDIGNVTLRSGDAFRLAESEQLYALGRHMYVYPVLLSVRAPAFPPSLQWGANGKRGGFLEDPLLIHGIREYQAGDAWRSINWRASSRTGTLQTNVFQPVVAKRLTIYIDVQGFVIDESAYADNPEKQRAYKAKKKQTFERFLSVIASVAVDYSKQKISVGYSGNALDREGRHLGSVPPGAMLTPFLDQLAQMTPRVAAAKTTVLDQLIYERERSAPLFICSATITKQHSDWYVWNKHKLAEVRFLYMFESDYTEKVSRVAKRMESLLAASAAAQEGS